MIGCSALTLIDSSKEVDYAIAYFGHTQGGMAILLLSAEGPVDATIFLDVSP